MEVGIKHLCKMKQCYSIINVQKYSDYTKFVLMILYDLYPFV